MAYQLSTLRTTVQSRMRDTSFSSALLTQYANDVQRVIFNRNRFRFMEKKATLTTTQGSTALTGLPADLQIPLDLRITSPTSYATRLTYYEQDDFDKYYPQPSLAGTGVPILWTSYAGVPSIFPQADATAYNLELRYLKAPVELVNDTDVPDVPSEFQELMVLGMMMRALQTKEDFDQQAFYDQDFSALEIDFVTRYAQQGGVQPSIIRLNGR